MKKRKQKIDIIVIIILVIAATILLWQIIVQTSEPQFTIYKNECKNEPNTFDDGDNFLCSDGSYGFLNNTNILHKLNSSCYITTGEKEVCNLVEVYEIEGWFENSCSGLCDCYKSMSCELTERFILIFHNETNKNLMLDWIENYTQKEVKFENNKLYFEKGSYNDAIKLSMFNDICNLDTISMGESKCKGIVSKEDITGVWIEEQINLGNCDISQIYLSDANAVHDCKDNSCSKDTCNDDSCKITKYKCGDYEVEVN